MSKVYILGAGSSKNYSQSTTEVKGLEPPQDSDFFQMAKRVVIAQGGDYMFYGYNLEHFLKDLAKLYGYTELPEEPIDIFDDRRLSMEGVLTFFDIRKDLFE